jgi:hypothetical protein
LASIYFCYCGTAQQIDAAADGWCALPLQYLHLVPRDDRSLQRHTLLQLSKLTRLSSLSLVNGVSNDNIQPEMLGDVLAQLTRLQSLNLTRTIHHQQQQFLVAGAEVDAAAAANAVGDVPAVAATAQDAAADAAAGSFLTRLLHRLAGSLHKMQLSTLYLDRQLIGRAEAAARAEMEVLWKQQSGCDRWTAVLPPLCLICITPWMCWILQTTLG